MQGNGSPLGDIIPDRLLPKLTFVLGGARSGKSRFAENLVRQSEMPRTYIATAQAYDDEMRARIAAHKVQRGAGWAEREAPYDLADALMETEKGNAVLIDCATLWLSNHLLAGHDVDAKSAALCAALTDCAACVVVVSNEVGGGIVPENALARQFRDAQGKLNQKLALQSDCVFAVMAGLPLRLK